MESPCFTTLPLHIEKDLRAALEIKAKCIEKYNVDVEVVEV